MSDQIISTGKDTVRQKDSKVTQLRSELLSIPLEECSFPMRFRLLNNKLSQTERKIGDYFLENCKAAYLSINEVVEDSGLGYGSIIRFCKKLECAGFQEFKVLLAQEIRLFESKESKNNGDEISKYKERIKSELEQTADLINRDDLESIALAVNKANCILVGGVGASANPARAFNYLLSRIGLISIPCCDGHNLCVQAAGLKNEDAFIVISFSGATKDILAAAEIAKKRGVIIVSITNFIRSPLVDLSDYCIFTSSDRDPVSSETLSNVCSDFVLDILFKGIYRSKEDADTVVKRTYKAISDRQI